MKNIDDLKLIVLDNCKEFGQKVDKHLQKIRKNKNSYIVPVKLTRFNNGEAKAFVERLYTLLVILEIIAVLIKCLIS